MLNDNAPLEMCMTDSNADDNWLIDEDEDERPPRSGAPDQRLWRVLIVDDDVDVHAVTRLALRNVSFKGASWSCSRPTAAGSLRILRDTPDIALVLLDVVMETDDAGLLLARRIREELHNSIVRGAAHRPAGPGARAARHHRIRHQRLQGQDRADHAEAVHHRDLGLRAYESLNMLERSRIGLGKILAAPPICTRSIRCASLPRAC
jgi:CheY-like chemotaxis protein